jgi:glycosyltransferase involved in cell wall biosynthesis
MAPLLDVLIPTINRPTALAITLTSLTAQTFGDFRVHIADQSEEMSIAEYGEVQAVVNVLDAHGQPVFIYRNLPRQGMAQQRQFLLDQAAASYVLYLDDDVLLERHVLENMVNAMLEERCGFIGSALIGLTHKDDVREHEEQITFWEGHVTPETVRPGTPAWERHKLHNAANIYHLARRLNLSPERPRRYKVAWVGGCVLYDTEKLRLVGGFSFWKDLPTSHAGEDVLAQLRVMDAYGGCGIIPSGVYHLQLPTTISDRTVDAPKYLEIEVKKNESA